MTYTCFLFTFFHPPDPSAACRNGDVQLTGDNRNSIHEGRVEVCVGGEWGTICADFFYDDADARVICKQLGYTNLDDAIAISEGHYGPGDSDQLIFLNSLNCSGREERVTDCNRFGFGSSICTHDIDAGVVCQG